MAVFDDDDRTHFGPYRVIRRIGTGGMGSVFEAEDTGLGHRVALKLLHPYVAERPGTVRRFLREGRAAARVRHPHVVQVFALGTEGNTPYLAMELLEGGNLSDLIVSRGALAVGEALDLVIPVIAAVAAAHDAGVIHRDLKPSNVCIGQGTCARPWPKVVDFGVSKVVVTGGANEATMTETVIGTAAYMAPEQARAACNASFRSDQYSLGVMLYQCITGQLPFGGRSMYEVLESVMSAPVAPPSARAKDIPRALDEVVLRSMDRNPRHRFPSVRSFGASLLQLASEHTRTRYGPELEGRESVESGVPVASDLVGSHALVGLATPIGSSEAPPTGRDTAHRAPSVVKRTGVLAAAGLAVSVLVATVLAVRPQRPSTPPVEHWSVPFAAAPTAVDSSPKGIVVQSPLENVADHEPLSSASGIVPTASAPPQRPLVNPSRADRPRHRASPISFGDNDAPILP